MYSSSVNLGWAALFVTCLAACPSPPAPSPAPVANIATHQTAAPRDPHLAVAPALTIDIGTPGLARPDQDEVITRLREVDSRIVKLAPEFDGVGLTDNYDLSAHMIGVEADVLRDRGLAAYIVAGRLDLESAGAGAPIVMGKGLATRLHLAVGDTINLSIGPGAHVDFRVTGLFAVGLPDYDDNTFFAALKDITGGNGVTFLGLELDDPTAARDVAAAIDKAHLDKLWNMPVVVRPWR